MARLGVAGRGDARILPNQNTERNKPGKARHGMAGSGSERHGWERLGSDWLGAARLGSDWLGSAWLGWDGLGWAWIGRAWLFFLGRALT